MKNHPKTITRLFALLLVLMTVLSVADTVERRYETDFDQTRMQGHIAALTANGSRSIADPEENALALGYITDTLNSLGLVRWDRTDVPAYVVQDFVAEDTDYQNWYLQNIIVHIPANDPEPSGQAVMVMGHTDSVPMGPGASDDGVAVSTMLEAIESYLERMENGLTLKNDLIFCFVNGEEYGLYGSEAFVEEFTGFDNAVERIRFGINLESRGTSGSLIMFETAADNYETLKLFSRVNDNVFTCSIATMVYDQMPNGTDFSSFKDRYQGLNFANISGGENYHTQNDAQENMSDTYLSQTAMVVDQLLMELGNYDLDRLYEADGNAVFFSWLNAGTVVYSRTTAKVLAVVLLVMLISCIWLGRKAHTGKRTALGFTSLLIGLGLTAALTHGCYYLFQYIAVLAGVIDLHAVGTITYSNTAIVVGIGLAALAVTMLTARLCRKLWKIEGRDIVRAYGYLHAVLGVVLTFVLPDASYLFVFSGLALMANELVIRIKPKAAAYHGELLAAALYMPIIMPVLVLATSALGLTMAWVFGMVFALGIFAVGVWAEETLGSKGAVGLLAVAGVLFLAVSLTKPNASVNLQGKQNLAKLPWDDALVYVLSSDDSGEYRIYDMNAVSYLRGYAPELRWQEDHYAGTGDAPEIAHSIISEAAGNTLTVRKSDSEALVYLTFTDIDAESFTIDDGLTSNTYLFEDAETYGMTIHSNCTVTLNGGSAKVSYREVLRDYAALIPEDYDEEQKLHFNLWLTAEYLLGA